MRLKLLYLLFFISAYAFSQVSLIQNDEFTISPNPAKNTLNIKLSEKKTDLRVEVFDVLGKRVYKGLLTQLESSVDVSNWKSGVYLVRVSDNETAHTKRFIKQ
ncbi:T9SS type A sorting domain-containing protein [uncultured Winogradskyella sp.]|uniref:T9SS type A sorting domain-containing protein n=1 Tax=uncultured Winogradskyella sp. TaxID=395353 RepID=UPI0026286C26|nr:T9SS type A sorting domain-containing protein [uncultured Winogradskyella sp.]